MAETKRRISLAFLLFLAFVILTIQSEASTTEKSNEGGTGTGGSNGPVPVERAIGVPPGLTSRWSAVVDWAKLAWINLRQPESWYGSTKTEKVKEVVTQSFEMGKESVEAAADAAARAAGDVADVAKKTLERTVSIHPRREEDSSEL